MLGYRLPAITMRFTRKINQYYNEAWEDNKANFQWNNNLFNNTSNNIFIDGAVIGQLKRSIRDVTRVGLNRIQEQIMSKDTTAIFKKTHLVSDFSSDCLVKLFNITHDYDVTPYIKSEKSNIDDDLHVIKLDKLNRDLCAYGYKPEIFIDGELIQSDSSRQYKSV